MSMQTAIDQAQRNGWDTLRGAAAGGLHDMPPAFVSAYDDLRALLDRQPPAGTRAAPDAGTMERIVAEAAMTDWRAARDRDADQLVVAAGTALQPCGVSIETYIGEALAARLAQFAKDLTILGAHAGKVVPDDQVVEAATRSKAFGEAWLRFSATGSWYLRLKQSWAVLRRYDQAPGIPDPAGTDSILAEVANAPELRPDDWRDLRFGGQGPGSTGSVTDPWPIPVHTRLAAILRDGGRPWLPSARQQWAAFAPHVPDPTPHYLRGGRDNELGDPRVRVPAAGRPLVA